jgi:hypothetical protein
LNNPLTADSGTGGVRSGRRVSKSSCPEGEVDCSFQYLGSRPKISSSSTATYPIIKVYNFITMKMYYNVLLQPEFGKMLENPPQANLGQQLAPGEATGTGLLLAGTSKAIL